MILGGIKSIARVCEGLVPFMAVFYVLGCLVLLAMRYDTLPRTFSLIFETAFTGQAAVGGFIGAGMREPATDVLAENGAGGADLRHVEKCMICVPDDPLAINDGEAVGHALDDLLDRVRAGRVRRRQRRSHGRHLEEVERAGVRVHERGAQGPLRVGSRQAQGDAGRAPVFAHLDEHGLEGLAVAGRHVRKEFRPRQQTEMLRRRDIRLDDPQIGDAHDNGGLRRGVEQHLVAGLDLPIFPVIALALLLSQQQARLKIGNGLNILADGDETRLRAKAHGRVFEGELSAARQPLADLKTGGRATLAHVLDHFLDLRRDGRVDRFAPDASAPGVDALLRQGVGRHGRPDHAILIKRQRDVGPCEGVVCHRTSEADLIPQITGGADTCVCQQGFTRKHRKIKATALFQAR